MMDAEKVEKVCKGLECCADPGNCDPCPYTRGLEEVGCIQDMEKDALSVIRELKAENEQLKDKRINAAKRIEKLIEQHRHSRNDNTMGMVGGLRIALEIIGDEPKEGE